MTEAPPVQPAPPAAPAAPKPGAPAAPKPGAPAPAAAPAAPPELAGTASPGGVSATNQMLRQARASIRGHAHVGGGIAGRDIIVHYHGVPQPGGPLPRIGAQAVAAVRHAYVAPDGFADLTAALADRHLLILRAAAGQGAEAAAIRLLLLHEAEPLYRVDGTDLTGLTGDRLVKGAGYVLHGADPKRLRRSDIESLDTRLGELPARLVVILPAQAGPVGPDALPYVRDLGRAPDATAILRSHLAWRMGTAAATALLARVKDAIDAGAACQELADLARTLHEKGAAEPGADLAWIADWRGRRTAGEIAVWFDDLDDLPQRCLAISLALFNGLPFETVNAAATRLRRRITDPGRGQRDGTDIRLVVPAPALTDPFEHTRTGRVDRIRASITPTTLPAWFGDTPAQVMSYRDPAYPPAVLDRVWREHDDVRPTLVEWFDDLAGDPSEQVRNRVATAVGVLAARAFEYILTTVIDRWAASETAARREAAAVALHEPANEGGLYEQVLQVLRAWSQPGATVARRATAARAYGESVGAADPVQAIAALQYLADCEDEAVRYAIGRSLAQLMDRDEALAVPVLTAVCRWITGTLPQRRRTGYRAFLTIAVGLMTEVPSDTDGSPVRWPSLLRMADRDPAMLPSIAGLWHAALNGPLWEDAHWVFGLWALSAEADPLLRAALGRLAATVAQDGRTRKILRQLAADWTTGKNPSPTPETARAVLTALSERR